MQTWTMRTGLVQVIFTIALCATLLSQEVEAQERYHAWLNEPQHASRIRVLREGNSVVYGDGLRACDVVERIDQDRADRNSVNVVVVTIGGQRILLPPSSQIVVPCAARDADSALVVFLKSVWQGVNDRRKPVLAAERGRCDASHSDLAVPIIPKSALPTLITESAQPLELRWFGQFAPFTLEVRRIVDRNEAQPVVSLTKIPRPRATVSLPRSSLDTYTLTISDACGGTVMEHDLRIVATKARPPMPALLQKAPLDDVERTLWYANYLIGLGEGQWQVEALQLVARLPLQDDPTVREWLADWGG